MLKRAAFLGISMVLTLAANPPGAARAWDGWYDHPSQPRYFACYRYHCYPRYHAEVRWHGEYLHEHSEGPHYHYHISEYPHYHYHYDYPYDRPYYRYYSASRYDDEYRYYSYDW